MHPTHAYNRSLRLLRPLAAALLFLGSWFASPHSVSAGMGDCGQPTSSGERPVASDALTILISAVTPPNLCPPDSGLFDSCVCDVDGNGRTLASDALLTLQVAVGVPDRVLACNCLPPSTSTTSTTVTTSTTLPQAMIGVFVDAPVGGVSYQTETKTGVTNSVGEFEFLPGETVVFSIGDIVFPAVLAKGVLSPLDLAGTTDINHRIVVNIARLLQSLDTDGNPDNGITIDAEGIVTSDLNFDADPNVFADEVVDEMDLALISESEALAHLQAELDALEAGNGMLPTALSGKAFVMEFSTQNEGAPYTLGDLATFAFSISGSLAVDLNPEAVDGDEIVMAAFTPVGGEFRWEDAAGGFAYVASTAGDTINEINVFALAGGAFVGQFTPFSLEPIPNIGLVTALAGTYPVTGVLRGSHTRNTVSITANGGIDFDAGTTFLRSQIQTIFDRLFIQDEPRIQVSYGSDDDGEVINFYMVPGNTSVIQSIQFRHRNESVDNEVTVGPAE